MDTQHIKATQDRFAQSDARLARRRTWHDDPVVPPADPAAAGGNNPATVPYSEFLKLQGQYNGLKGHSDGLQNQLVQANGRITTLQTEYEGQLTTARTERNQAVVERDGFKAQHETVAQKAARLESEVGLTKTILSKPEYAPLQSLYADGLIRVDGMTAEETTVYLDKMAAKFTGGVNQAAQQALQGTTPPITGGTDPLKMTQPQMLEKLMTMDPNSKEYRDLASAYTGGLENKPVPGYDAGY